MDLISTCKVRQFCTFVSLDFSSRIKHMTIMIHSVFPCNVPVKRVLNLLTCYIVGVISLIQLSLRTCLYRSVTMKEIQTI